jgi:hypothetical protein
LGSSICDFIPTGNPAAFNLCWTNTILPAHFYDGNFPFLGISCGIFFDSREKKWGALIVIQRETGLRSYKEAGTPLKAEVSTPLLMSIFNPGSPMHDGAVILQNTLLEAAGCILPLTESPMVLPEMGTRHRAALGITEESDAIVVVV